MRNLVSYLASKSAFLLTLPHILMAYACIISSELDSWSCWPLVMEKRYDLESPTHLAVHSGIETMCPTVAVVPVKIPPHGKQLVLGARIGHISNQRIDIVLVLVQPI